MSKHSQGKEVGQCIAIEPLNQVIEGLNPAWLFSSQCSIRERVLIIFLENGSLVHQAQKVELCHKRGTYLKMSLATIIAVVAKQPIIDVCSYQKDPPDI